MIYSIPYLIFISVLIVISILQLTVNLTNRSINTLNFTSISIIVVFLGLRGFIATDWVIYYPYFQNIPSISQLFNTPNAFLFEPGFVVYTSFIKTIFPNYHFFILISLVLDLVLLKLFFRNYLSPKFFVLFLCLYFAFFGFVYEVNLMRNVKSLLFFLISIKYIESRNWRKYFLLNFIGLLFHWTSLVFLPLYFFLHKRLSLRTAVVVLSIGFLIFILKVPFIKPIVEVVGNLLGGIYEEKLNFYINSTLYGQRLSFSFGYVERIITTVFVLVFYRKLLDESKTNVLFINAFIIFISISLYFAEIEIALTRFSALLIFSYWILLPKIMSEFKVNFRPLFLIYLYLIIFLKMYLGTNNILYKYDNILYDKIMTPKERYVIFDKMILNIQENK